MVTGISQIPVYFCSVKKLAILLILLVYGVSSFGISVHFHYCCGKLKDVNIITVANSCGMDHKKGDLPCCDDKEVSLQIKSDQHASKTFYSSFQNITPQVPNNGFTYSIAQFIQKKINPKVAAPSPPNNYLLDFFCTYLI